MLELRYNLVQLCFLSTLLGIPFLQIPGFLHLLIILLSGFLFQSLLLLNIADLFGQRLFQFLLFLQVLLGFSNRSFPLLIQIIKLVLDLDFSALVLP